MPPHVLRDNPTQEDNEWSFAVPENAFIRPRHAKPGEIYGKSISFTAEKITLQMEKLNSNRILRSDDPRFFVRVSFGGLRFPETSIRITGEYISRFFKKGLSLNGVQYRFYHHSNSQLRERSCFLREANNDQELDQRIYQLGDFQRIMVVAKRAKRIGLLFSAAELDYNLDPRLVGDIPDIKVGDEVFSDGCGLISCRLAKQLSRHMYIIYRGQRYVPTVFQIRYLGYKGVLMLHPQLDTDKKHLAEFRSSMKKFSTTADQTFSVVNHSRPYIFGRLNNDVLVLLNSLGVSNDAIRAKQQEYFRWIEGATEDPVKAVDMLYCVGQYELAENVLLKGLDDPQVFQKVARAQASEVASFNKGDKFKSRMIIHHSRRLYGVCDPFGELKEGQVHIRITVARKGATTPLNCDVLVVRNPCLHPGDCLKLRAVHNDKLAHLVDCVVFASVGRRAAPTMSSGGDLDGDEYFVCWDKNIVQPYVSQSYDYPPNREHTNAKVTREDLANYFAAYNNVGVARVSALHAKWVRGSEKGAMSQECQELNALHSKAVDGGKIKIPDRLLSTPEAREDFILTLLEKDVRDFQERLLSSADNREAIRSIDTEDGKQLVKTPPSTGIDTRLVLHSSERKKLEMNARVMTMESFEKKQRNPPAQCKLWFIAESTNRIKADVRVDARISVRLHSHVRLKAASKAENRWLGTLILDGIVYQASVGEFKIELFHPAPPEMERMDWNLYNAGSVATSRSMIDALLRLLTEKEASCGLYSVITSDPQVVGATSSDEATLPSVIAAEPESDHNLEFTPSANLNDSQLVAVDSCDSRLTLIWGPPGTGKTTVVIQILRKFLSASARPKVLMTASTHNAVDNVLERFIEVNLQEKLLRDEQILRVATDQSKVNKALRDYTIDARVGGDVNENNRLLKKAKERVENAIIVFTTCAGAGLGVLRDVDFDITLIDEASQVTEPGALVPLVKGVKKAVLVGDHVQLRPTVRNMGKALQVDVSLLERLYSHDYGTPDVRKTMLDVQYRFSRELNAFPSREFYEGRLKTGNEDSRAILQPLFQTGFPWPRRGDSIIPTVFIQCSAEEDMGGRSKSNTAQAELVQRIVPLLSKKPDGTDTGLGVTVLTPYTKQIQELRSRLPQNVCSTVDAFQGRESDVIIFSTVRCNVEGEIGFLDDPRRLNVMWTRARLALVIVGDRRTMCTNDLWKRAIEACTEVDIPEA